MRILIALSGGIDSSTVAHLLKEQGHDLVAVRFTLWSDPLAPSIAEILPSKCCNAQTAYRTRQVAETLGIPLHIVDLESEFKEHVVDPFLDGYRKGLTPNPCIRCNREIKFGKLLKLADEFGCEKLATGHYARVAEEIVCHPEPVEGRHTTDVMVRRAHHDAPVTKRHLLLEAVDGRKDQSYYLYGLSQEQLARVLFPLGGMQKQEVFELAKHFGVPFDDEYRESQDLCFFPEKKPEEFLKRYLSDALVPGPIVRKDGTVVGTHKGLPLYTVGQRRGLGIGGLTIPLEVVSKNTEKNELIVEEQKKTVLGGISLHDIRWVSWQPQENEDIAFECRVRSLSERKKGTLKYNGTSGEFRFDTPNPPLAPGQSLVLYRGLEVVGGGVIE